jgi:hypothetical protein
MENNIVLMYYYNAEIIEHWKQCNSTIIIAIIVAIKVMPVPNLNLSMLLSQHADTVTPMYEIIILVCKPLELLCEFTVCQGYVNLLYVKERLAIYYSLLKRSLRFSYGQHDIEWGSPTALHVTRINVKRKADIEHPPAMIEVMNQIKYALGHGPLARKVQENISSITVERVRPTTDISRQERKRQIVQMAH